MTGSDNDRPRYPYFVFIGPMAAGKTCYIRYRRGKRIGHHSPYIFPAHVRLDVRLLKAIKAGATLVTALDHFLDGEFHELPDSREEGLAINTNRPVPNPLPSTQPTIYIPLDRDGKHAVAWHIMVDVPGNFLTGCDKNNNADQLKVATDLIDHAAATVLFLPYFQLFWYVSGYSELPKQNKEAFKAEFTRRVRENIFYKGETVYGRTEAWSARALDARVERMSDVLDAHTFPFDSWIDCIADAPGSEKKVVVFLSSMEPMWTRQIAILLAGAGHKVEVFKHKPKKDKDEVTWGYKVKEMGLSDKARRQLVVWDMLARALQDNNNGEVKRWLRQLAELVKIPRKDDGWGLVAQCLREGRAAVVNAISEDPCEMPKEQEEAAVDVETRATLEPPPEPEDVPSRGGDGDDAPRGGGPRWDAEANVEDVEHPV